MSVFRSELNPVDFLRRAAYIYPELAASGRPPGLLAFDGDRAAGWCELARSILPGPG